MRQNKTLKTKNETEGKIKREKQNFLAPTSTVSWQHTGEPHATYADMLLSTRFFLFVSDWFC